MSLELQGSPSKKCRADSMNKFPKYDRDLNTGAVLTTIAVLLAILVGARFYLQKREQEVLVRSPAPIIAAVDGRNSVTSFTFSPDSRSLIAGRQNGELVQLSLESGEITHVQQLSVPLTTIVADTSSQNYAVGSSNGQVSLLTHELKRFADIKLGGDAEGQDPVTPLEYYADVVSGRRVTPNAEPNRLRPNSLGVKKADGGRIAPVLMTPRSGKIQSLIFYQQDFLVAATVDGLFHLLHLPSQKAASAFGSPAVPDQGAFPRRTFNHEESLFFGNGAIETKIGDDQWLALRWNLATRKMSVIHEETRRHEVGKPAVVAVTSDGSNMFFVKNRTIVRMSTLGGQRKELFDFPLSHSGVSKLTLSPDDRYVLVVGTEKFTDEAQSSMLVWDTEESSFVFRVEQIPCFVSSAKLSPDNTRIAAVDGDGNLRLWETAIDRRELIAPVLGKIKVPATSSAIDPIIDVTLEQELLPAQTLQYALDGKSWRTFSLEKGLDLGDQPPGRVSLHFRLINSDWQTSNVRTADLDRSGHDLVHWQDADELGLSPIAAAFDFHSGNLKTIDPRAVFVERDPSSGEVRQQKQLDHEPMFHTAFNLTGSHVSLSARSFSGFLLYSFGPEPVLDYEKIQADPFHFVTTDESGSTLAARTIYALNSVEIWQGLPTSPRKQTSFVSGESCFFSTSGDLLLCRNEEWLRVHAVDDGTVVAERNTPHELVTKPPGTDRIYVVRKDAIEICDFSLQKQATVPLTPALTAPSHAAAAAHENTVVVAEKAGVIRVLKLDNNSITAQRSIRGHSADFRALAINANGELIFSSTRDGVSKMWNVARLLGEEH